MTIDTVPTGSCPSVFDGELPTVAYDHLTNPDEAHRIIAQARGQAPIAIGPHGPEVLSYALVRTVLRDPRFAMPHDLGLAAQGITSGPVWDRVTKIMLSLNGAEHLRLRRVVVKAFTPRATERLRALIGEVITELVDPLTTAGRCDVVADIARQYPIPIICALLGAPRKDWQLFSAWTDGIKKIFDWNVANDTPAILCAWEALDAYIEGMIAERRQAPTDDLMSDLIRAEDDGDRLTHDELLVLAATLLGAGTDTTRNQLGASVQVLCNHPDQWALLAEHPELAPNAVEETMRHSPIIFTSIRVATEDVELGGVVIPAGTVVLANTAAANRDPDVYHHADRLDITRDSPRAMLTFGGGAHYCLGTHLARLELTQALTVMTRRMPNARRAGAVPWKAMTGITGPTLSRSNSIPGIDCPNRLPDPTAAALRCRRKSLACMQFRSVYGTSAIGASRRNRNVAHWRRRGPPPKPGLPASSDCSSPVPPRRARGGGRLHSMIKRRIVHAADPVRPSRRDRRVWHPMLCCRSPAMPNRALPDAISHAAADPLALPS